ncbi:MAG: hypothetical protein Fur0041_05360 [Bacteroidia bacterium]
MNSNLGNLLLNKGEPAKAIECIARAKKFLTAGCPFKIKDRIRNVECSYFTVINQHEKSIEIRSKAMAEILSSGDSTAIAANLHNMCISYYKLGNYDMADSLVRKAYEINKLTGNNSYLIRNLTMMGNISNKKKDIKSAIAFNEEVIALSQALNDNYVHTTALINVCDLYYYVGQKQKAFDAIEKGINMAAKYGFKEWRLNGYNVYSILLENEGRYKEANEYLRLYINLSDSILNQENLNKLAGMEKELNKNKVENLEKEKIIASQKQKEIEAELSRQKITTYFIIALSVLMMAGIVFIYRGYRSKQQANTIISSQNASLEQKNKEITDSISYAKRIQYTLLAHDELLKKNLKEHFVFYQPKDIVSGDFYWATEKGNKFYLAVCDSTGHGVPGAFMSLLNISFLNEAINEKDIEEPSEILNYVRQKLISNFTHENAQDGMDGVLFCFEKGSTMVRYASAYITPVLFSAQQSQRLACDKMPVGVGVRQEPFSTFTFDVKPNDILYITTDGYADQFGGEEGKKLMFKNLLVRLNSIKGLSFPDQRDELSKHFNAWKGDLEQIDDVTVMGVRF